MTLSGAAETAAVKFLPGAISLLPGAIAASVGLFGSLVLQFAGPIPLALDRLGPTEFNPATRLRIFAVCFKRAAPLIIITGAIAAASSLFPTFAYPDPQSKVYLRTAGAAFLMLNPYTLLTLLDTNKQLLAMNRNTRATSEGTLNLSEAEGKKAMQLMEDWTFWANLRVGFFAVGWVGIIMGLGKELRVI